MQIQKKKIELLLSNDLDHPHIDIKKRNNVVGMLSQNRNHY